jgi:hypothetical protein
MIRHCSIYVGLTALICCLSAGSGALAASESEPILVDAPDQLRLDSDTIKADESTKPVPPVEPVVIGLPIHLPVADAVQDPIFSILIGLIEHNVYGTLSQSRLQNEVDRQGRPSKLPYQSIQQVVRLPMSEDRPTGEVEVRFDGDIKLAIPYSILGYNPGSLRASAVCLFQEWDLGDLTLAHPVKKEGDKWIHKPVELTNAHLFGIVEGELLLDIDGWLDKLLGGKLDDTEITALLLCQYEGDWHGFAMGYNSSKKGRSGALNFRKDKVVFPSPSEIKTVGRRMRSRVEKLMAEG